MYSVALRKESMLSPLLCVVMFTELFQQERQIVVSKKSITRFTLNPHDLPKQKKVDAKRLDGMRDQEIDYSDIPELDEAFWKNVAILRPMPKQMLTMRVDKEVADWFRAQGKGYQGLMNSVLRAFVEAQRQH